MFQFDDIFSPYSRYCSEQTNCQEYCKEQDRNNDIFKAYLAVSHDDKSPPVGFSSIPSCSMA